MTLFEIYQANLKRIKFDVRSHILNYLIYHEEFMIKSEVFNEEILTFDHDFVIFEYKKLSFKLFFYKNSCLEVFCLTDGILNTVIKQTFTDINMLKPIINSWFEQLPLHDKKVWMNLDEEIKSYTEFGFFDT